MPTLIVGKRKREKLYEIIVKDDTGTTIHSQLVLSDNYDLVDLQGQKYKMFYGFGTTYEIGE